MKEAFHVGVFDKNFDPIGGIVGAASTVAKMGEAIGKGAIDIACGIGEAASSAANQIQRNINRPKTPFYFEDGISQEEFSQIAGEAAHTIKRIAAYHCDGPIARFTVRSQSNITEWAFSVDFNAWGHFTGEYWLRSENADSKIPSTIAKRMSETIKARIS